MRYGIFADVHSNLEALEAVVNGYKDERIDRYLCVGDIVGYAANPLECIQIIKRLSPVMVAGNHDWGAVGRLPFEYFSRVAREAIIWTSSVLGSAEKDFLFGLPLLYTEGNFILVHGTLFRPQDFYYLNTAVAASRSFTVLDKQLCFVGHTHKPGVFVEQDKDLSFRKFSSLKIENNKRYIINVGSVGQPRDGNPQAAFAIYDTDEKIVELKRVTYNFSATQEKILKLDLPGSLARRLSEGV